MRSKPKNNSRFWLVSALLHGAAAVALVLTPAGQKIVQREERPLKPEVTRKDEKLAEVIEDIRDLAVVRLKSRVDLLKAGRDRMATNFDTMNRHYQPFVAQQIASARERLLQEGEKTLKLQKEILEAARRAVTGKEAASDPMWRVFDKNRAALIAGQEEIRRALLLTAATDTALIALQDQSETTQMDAFEALSRSVNAQKLLLSSARELQPLAGHKAWDKQEIIKGEARVVEFRSELERLKAEEAAAAQDAVGKIRERQAETEKKLSSSLAWIDSRHKRIAKIRQDQKRLTETLALKEPERDAQAARTVELQEQALTAQAEVVRQLLALLESQPHEASPAGAKTEDSPL